MLTPYLLSVAISLAAANPILQRIPIQLTGQSYPVPLCPTCPTQTCSTCPAQTCPATSRPCQTCQNPYRNFPHPMVLQSNSCPCNKPSTVQNPLANSFDTEVLQQLILRRLLSSPMQPNPAPVKTCTQCETQKSTPNIINNYIIVPPEYFKANETKVDKNESVKRRKNSKRRKQRRQRTDPECPEDNDELNNDKIIANEHEHTSKSISDVKIQDNASNSSSKLKTETVSERIISKNIRAQNEQQVYSENDPVNTIKPRGRNREETKNLEEAIIRDFCRKNPSIPKEIASGLLKNIKHRVEGNNYSNYSPYPYSPFGYSPYNPQMFYPRIDEYEAYIDRGQRNRGSRRRDNKRRSGRKNKKPKEVKEGTCDSDKKCENIVESNPSVINIEKEIITTEKITATTENKIKENCVKDSETQMETPEDLLDQLDKMKAKFAKLNEIETTTVSYNKRIEQYPELGKEDKVPTVYDNGVDDYYPDFREGYIEYYPSDETCDADERYHYKTNKNEGHDSQRYVNKKPNQINNNSNKDESNESYKESVKQESAEIRFRVPPNLETIDFETRPITRYSQINDDIVADDLNSDAKADPRIPEIEMKQAKVFTKDKSGRTNIETVLGHSRVVRYGQDAEAAGSEPVITYYLPEEAMTEDRIQLPDGETVIVVAKSIRDLEGWNSQF